jgi:hypothetical protein
MSLLNFIMVKDNLDYLLSIRLSLSQAKSRQAMELNLHGRPTRVEKSSTVAYSVVSALASETHDLKSDSEELHRIQHPRHHHPDT